MADLKVAFWNVENLFDHRLASRDPNLWYAIRDELVNWTAEVRDQKIQQLGQVLRALEVDLIGLCEIENEHVLKMLAKKGGQLKPADIRKRPEDRFQPVGHPSPDKRGIDVCFLYDQSRLDVIEGGFHAVALGYPTRDIVWARFETLKEKKTFIAIACHWPSRGNPSSKREKVAVAVRKVAAFLQKAYGPEMPVMLMGDLNDGPKDKSVWTSLRARNRDAALNDTSGTTFFNATQTAVSPKTKGTHYYKKENQWSTLDHIIVSRRFLQNSSPVRVEEGSGAIFSPHWVRRADGTPRRFGRPRTETDTGGFSDHFAVTLNLSI